MHASRASARLGLIYGSAAYLAWGFIAIYFKLLTHVPPLVLLAHRIVWSSLFLLILLAGLRRWQETRQALRSRAVMLGLVGSTLMIAANWYTFIWAVTNQHVVEASLGYFINPLVVTLLGFVVLHERLRPMQWSAVVLAGAGVAYQVLGLGQIPWIALILATSFGFYGLIRKTAHVSPLVGLAVETVLLLPVGALIAARHLRVELQTSGADLKTYLLLMLSGVLTAIPLLWFAAGARRLRLATIGFLQYIAPTCQLLVAVLLFGEPFELSRLVTFACIWAGLTIYSIDSILAYRQSLSRQVMAEVPEP